MREGRGARLGVALALLVGGCNSDALDPAAKQDASMPLAPRDLSVVIPDEGPPDLVPELCSPDNPLRVHYGPPQRAFPLQGDATPDPLERDFYLERDADGYLVTPTLAPGAFSYVWVTSNNGNVPTVIKLDRSVREVARYPVVTCGSLPTGSTAACDGMSGCCSLDDPARYAARQAKLPEPGHQAVAKNGSPGQVAMDWNGDALVSTQNSVTPAVTRIATTVADCVDRNKNGRIDTSSDADKNGFIEVDCNGDSVLDDIASVKAKPCLPFKSQEYFGLDDECVLWTTNVLPDHDTIGAFAIGPSDNRLHWYTHGDVWVGSAASGAFLRVDGTTGLAVGGAQLPAECLVDGNGPGGMVIDNANGYAWVQSWKKGRLCWFDPENPARGGSVREPAWGSLRGGGVALDPNGNVWLSSTDGIARYTPGGLAGPGSGWWTRLLGLAGEGIDVDRRGAAYFAWACELGSQSAIQIPASTIPVVKMDSDVAPANWPHVAMPCINLFVDSSQYLWGVGGEVTRVKVDGKGAFSQPKVDGPPQGIDYCPRGDSCPSQAAGGNGRPRRVRTFDVVEGFYGVMVPGCHDRQGRALPTEWGLLSWDADVPPNTSLSIRAATGHSGDWDAPSWDQAQRVDVPWPSPVCLSELVLPDPAPLGAGEVADAWLQLEVTFKYGSASATARLKSFDVTYRCK